MNITGAIESESLTQSSPSKLNNTGGSEVDDKLLDPSVDFVRRYHQRTKHCFEGYAKGPDTLDWDSQPNPFRHFDGCEKIDLPLKTLEADLMYSELFSSDKPVAQHISLATISTFLRLSLGLSAWKQYGPDKWSLRVNPSSGNLHPTETYLAFPQTESGIEEGLYHYNVEQHQLERRANGFSDSSAPEGFLLGFSSVLWREAWKYGERSFRYSQLDVGHAIATITSAAQAMGWQVEYLQSITGSKLSAFLGLTREEYKCVESEVPECLFHIRPLVRKEPLKPLKSLLPQATSWFGRPSKLGGRTFYKWPIVDEIATMTECSSSNDGPLLTHGTGVERPSEPVPKLFSDVVFQRRSAQAYSKGSISTQQFKSIIEAVLFHSRSDFCQNLPNLHLVLMVHRVASLSPGVYFIPSSSDREMWLEESWHKWADLKPEPLFDFPSWNDIAGSKLYALEFANVQKLAAVLSCQQAIAADCAFTIGFLAEFNLSLEHSAGFAYREMHWHAGVLAQQVYQQATALDLAATGIGCFFDDPCHKQLGINNTQLQLIYQVAVGKPIVDSRITNFSGYHHLKRNL